MMDGYKADKRLCAGDYWSFLNTWVSKLGKLH